jgi:hypothetical protein
MSLRNRIALAALAYAVVCGMGLLIASAGGATWGSFDAGYITFMTLVMASGAFAGVLLVTGGKF